MYDYPILGHMKSVCQAQEAAFSLFGFSGQEQTLPFACSALCVASILDVSSALLWVLATSCYFAVLIDFLYFYY